MNPDLILNIAVGVVLAKAALMVLEFVWHLMFWWAGEND